MVERSSVLAAVERVLRHDLRFGQAAISEQTVLVGGELPLDSLDLLMVVTGTEKALGIKLPGRRIDASVLKTVGSFVDFVCSESGAAAEPR
ncbi:MAG: acyl carrier protein [Phycisphaeraceae bacterium]|nr:acyl carrier protein [Phycisphaeraceae bacterium]